MGGNVATCQFIWTRFVAASPVEPSHPADKTTCIGVLIQFLNNGVLCSNTRNPQTTRLLQFHPVVV